MSIQGWRASLTLCDHTNRTPATLFFLLTSEASRPSRGSPADETERERPLRDASERRPARDDRAVHAPAPDLQFLGQRRDAQQLRAPLGSPVQRGACAQAQEMKDGQTPRRERGTDAPRPAPPPPGAESHPRSAGGARAARRRTGSGYRSPQTKVCSGARLGTRVRAESLNI